MTGPIAKHWVLTFQTNQTWPSELPQGVSYLLVGAQEAAPETGALHRHGVVIFCKKQRASYVRRMFPGVHHEVMRGTVNEARTYCLKEGPAVLELGDFTPVKEKQKISEAIAAILEAGGKPADVRREYPGFYLCNRNKIFQMWHDVEASKAQHVERTCIWIYGPSGIGKTRFAVELFPDAPILDYEHPFMHGYNLEKAVILDELRAGTPLRALLRLTDRYRASVNVKNGSAPWLARAVIITAPEHPVAMFPDTGPSTVNDLVQLTRRLDFVVRFTDSEVFFHDGNDGVGMARDDGIARLRAHFNFRMSLC